MEAKRWFANRIKVHEVWIGQGEPCFIIAEAGVNHNGDIGLARKLIEVAREAGADAVKFQTFNADILVTKSAAKASYQKVTTGAAESQFEMIKGLELTDKDFTLSTHARKKGIIFLSTPFDKSSVDLLDGLGVPAFKISSGEITNFPLLKHIARKKKPLILSTGMSTLGEIEEALEVIRKERMEEIILLHCVSCYPAAIGDMNLKTMDTLRCAFGLPVGLSDHTVGITVPVAAVALGACVIEKHFTLDKELPGPDHRASLSPDELKELVGAIRDVEKSLGDGMKIPTAEEEENKMVGRRSIVAKVDIPQGAIITEEMIVIKRPGTGLKPNCQGEIIGRTAKEAIKEDDLITWRALK